MLRRWIAVLGVASSTWVSGARAQQQGQTTPPSPAQTTQNEISTLQLDTPIKVQANLVLVRVVVRDAAGNFIPGLRQEDFQVSDNGKKQRISAFSEEKGETPPKPEAAPVDAKATKTETANGTEGESGASAVQASAIPKRFVALVFDDSHLKAADAMAVRAATTKLFATLTPTDRVAVYRQPGPCNRIPQANAEDFTKDAGGDYSPSGQG